MDDLSQNPYSAFFAPGSPQASVSNALGSNPYAQFFGGSSSTAQSQAAQAVVVQPQAPQTGVAAQWASAGPMDRLKMLGQNFMPTAEKVVPPIAKDFAAQGINTVGTAAGATLGSSFGPLGTGAGAAGGNALGQLISTELGFQPKVQWGQVAGAGIMPAGSGPITAPLAAVVGVNAQSLIDQHQLASPTTDAAAVLGGYLARGVPEAEPPAAATKIATLNRAREIGYVVPDIGDEATGIKNSPSAQAIINRTNPKENANGAIIQNQKLTQGLAQSYIGAPPGFGFSEPEFLQLQAPYNAAYEQLGALSPTAASDLKLWKIARDQTNSLYQDAGRTTAGNRTEILDRAQESAEDQDLLEQSLADEAQKSGNPQLYQNFQNARVGLAKINTTMRATNLDTGEVDPTIFSRMAKKGVPLTDEAADIASFTNAYPQFSKPASKITNQTNAGTVNTIGKRLFQGAIGTGAGIVGHLTGTDAWQSTELGATAALAAPRVAEGISNAAKNFLISPTFQQSAMAQPYFGSVSPGIAQNLARFAPQQINALQPTPALLTQNTQ